MAAKPRDRYIVTHEKYSVNGFSMKDVVVIMLGPCSSSGKRKDVKGKKLPKGDYTHFLLRFEDKKVAKAFGLPETEFSFDQKHFNTYFELFNA